jgi:hypothetical protein
MLQHDDAQLHRDHLAEQRRAREREPPPPRRRRRGRDLSGRNAVYTALADRAVALQDDEVAR